MLPHARTKNTHHLVSNLPTWLQVGSPLTTLPRVNPCEPKIFGEGNTYKVFLPIGGSLLSMLPHARMKNTHHLVSNLPAWLQVGQPLDHSSTGQSGTFGEGNTYKVFLQGGACSACCHMQE